MKTTKKLLVLLLSLVTVFAVGMTVACSKEDSSGDSSTGGGNTPIFEMLSGDFYAEIEDGDEIIAVTLKFADNFDYELTVNGDTHTGKYVLTGSALRLFENDEPKYEAVYADGMILLTFEQTQYRLLIDTTFEVTFNAGGVTIKTALVRNGKTVDMPAAPEKEGHKFIGWFKDAAFNTPFLSTDRVGATLTLYAKYQNIEAEEYEVTYYDANGDALEELATVTTTNKTLATLLENDKASFVGWWTSDTLDPNQLTARFSAGTVLTEDICLYAVYNNRQPSLSAAGASWALSNKNNPYTATLTDPDQNTTTIKTGTGSDSTAVTFGKGGLYILEVKEGTSSIGKAYYVHNRLSRPSALTVSGNEFLFTAVDGATEYELIVQCGDGDHRVTLKDTYSYDFSDCKMSAEGIKFTVTAKAEGYQSAASVPYVLKRDLDEIESLTYNKEKARIEWSAVGGAEEYEVALTYDGETITFTTQDLFYGVADKTGSITLSVKPVRKGYYSPEAKELVHNRTEQITPTGLSYAYVNNNDNISWTEVPGANGYKIIATGKDSSREPKVFDNINGTSYEFKPSDLAVLGEEMEIQVIAKGATAENDSYPAFLKIKAATTGLESNDITYENGVLSWAAVRRATSYTVKFPDGTTTTIEGATYCKTPEFTTAGKNAFTITDSMSKNSAMLDVYVYAIMFETNGGPVETQYKAKGDAVTLPDDADRIGYEFLGWYNSSDDSTALKYGSSFTFNANSSMTIFAGWDPCKYQLTLDVAGGAALEEAEKVKEVTYKKADVVFPVPGIGADASKLFFGWYSAPNGQGTRYVDQYGKMVRGYNMAEDATLYAHWPTAFEFEANEVENEEIKSYKVKKGRDIDLFADGEVTVPAYYNGKKVNYIKGAAFEDCKFKILNLPQTMYTIEILVSQTGTAFAGCSKLEAINVYDVPGYVDALSRYFSYEGVLYFENEGQVTNEDNTELAFVPRAKTGTITIPEGVETIPAGTLGLYTGESTFASHKFTDVVVPYTVTTIGDKAFAQSTYLETVVFEQVPAGKTAKPLNFGKDVFKGCSNLETVDLPSRIASFSATMFNGCIDLVAVNIEKGGADYKSVDGVVFTADGKKLVYFPRGIRATEDSPSLGKYVIPEGVEVIGSNAFSGSRLTELVISADVKTIEPYAFGGVADEKDGASLTGSLKGNYYGNPMPLLETLTFVGSDDHTLEIGEGAFFYAGGGLSSGKLAEVTLPRNLTKLGEYAFAGRGAIKTVTIELDGNKYSDGFDYADTAFYVSEKVSNPWVTTVNIGKDVPAMESLSALFGGNQLETINVDENNNNYQFDDGVLYDKDADGKKTKILYYLDSREGAYVLPETITEIPAGTFRRKGNVVDVTLHAGVKFIGDEAFLSCGKLTSITILGTPEGGDVVELILGNNVFNGCSSLTSVNLPTRTRKLGKGVFMGCYTLTEIVIPEGVTELGDGMFSKNSTYSTYDMKLVSVTLPSTLEKFGSYVKDETGNEVLDSLNAFEGCNSLETVNVNSGNKYFASVNGILYNGSLNDQNVFVPKQLIVCPVNLMPGSGETLVVTLPGTVTRIWTGAFKNNKNVSAISFEEAVGEDYSLTIDSDAFGGCKSLSTFELPEGLKTITAGTFKGCTSLVTIVIPSTVELIENNAFSGCTKLANVIFAEPAEGTTIAALEIADGTYNESESGGGAPSVSQSSAFYNCPALKSISFPERMTRLGQYVFYQSALESVELPSTLAEMGKYAFAYTNNLETVTFRTNDAGKAALTKIPERAFYQSKKLSSITIPEGVTEIEMWAFYDCTNLASAMLPSTLVEIGTSAFNKCILTDLTIADGSVLETIGTFAFSGAKFTSFTVPATVKTLDSSAFSGCDLLSSVTFAVGEDEKSVLEKIGDSAFANTALTEMILPETVDTLKLGTALFSSCKSINKIYLPSTVASITNVFTGCKSDYLIEIADDNPNMAVDSTYPIVISPNKTEMLFAYRQLDLKNGLLEIADGYTAIKQNAFASQSGIVKLSLPYTLVTLETGAFHDCYSLEEVEFRSKNNQTAFETMAAAASSSTSYGVFQNCYALSKINLPSNDSFKVIGDKAFANCYSLETITIPKGIETIGSTAGTSSYSSPTTSTVGAFGRCFALKSVTLPSTLKKLNDYTFANCTALSEITIPASVEKIGIGVFALCESLETLDLSKCTKLKELGNSAFRESGLTSFEIPKSITKLGTGTSYGYVFYQCKNLKTVTFAAGTKLSYVLGYTFAYSGIETIDLSTALLGTATLGTNLFDGCENLTDVKLPSALTSLGNSMFKNCTSLTGVKLDENGNPVIENGDYVYTLELPESLAFMGTNTFQGSGLIAIKIPAGIEGLANTKANSTGSGIKYGNYNSASSVFQDCLNLNKVVFLGNPKLIGKNTFSGCASLETIVAKDVDGYTADAFFKNLKFVGNDVFRGTAIKEANFDALERMGDYMFAESALEKVTFANNVIYNGKTNGWGKYAFSKCENLKGVELDENGDPVIKNGDYVYTIQLPASNYYSTYTFSESGLIAIKFPAGTTALSSSATANSNSSIYTFRNCTDLKKVVFEGKVTLIGGYAFDGCTSLSAIVGSDGNEVSFFGNLTSVGAYAFRGTAITKATLTNLTTMGNYAFAESKIAEVSFGKKLTSGSYAFENCKSLGKVTLSDQQDKIFISMFSQCKELESINLPDAIKTIDNNAFASTGISGTVTLPKSLTLSGLSSSAFWNCNVSAYALGNNTNFSVNNGVLFDAAGTKLISVPKKYSGALDLSNITDIAAYAFVFCDSITSVTFPAEVEAIPASAFKYWYMSDDIAYAIPSTVKTIGAYAFDGSNLKGELVIPEGVTSIGNYAFQNTDITSVVIPSTVKSIGSSAFSGCESLTTVKFIVTDGEGIEEIGAYAFKGSALTEITLPATLAYTKNEDAPNGETNIGSNAFENCVDLKTVIVEEGIVKLGNPSSTTGSKLFYNSGVESVTLPSTLEIIGQYTFAGTKLTSVTLPNNLKTIANYAFQYAPLTGTLVIPEGVEAIGTYAFMGKEREAILDEDGNEAGEYDYTGCSTIQKIVLPESCITINTSAFANLYDLAEVNLENVQTIGNGAFAYAGAKLSESEGLELTFSALKSVTATDPTIKDGVKTKNGNGPFAFVKIAKATFENAAVVKGKVFFETTYLGEVVLPDGLTELPADFLAFSAITEITIPATVEVIKNSAFEGCLSLTEVAFEEGAVLKTMEYWAFYNCISLTDIVLPDSLESMGHNVFSYCTSLKSVVIPYDVAQQNNNPLFAGWTAEQTIYFRIEEKYFYTSFFADTLKNCEAQVVYGYKG